MNAINGDQILALLESLSRPSFPAELARVLLATLDVDAVRLETIADGAAGPTTIAVCGPCTTGFSAGNGLRAIRVAGAQVKLLRY